MPVSENVSPGGYIPPTADERLQALADALQALLDGPHRGELWDDDQPGPLGALHLVDAEGYEDRVILRLALDAEQIRVLLRAAQTEAHADAARAARAVRVAQMADLLVAERRAGIPLIRLLALALWTAAERSFMRSAWALTQRQPKTWEATLVREMAAVGPQFALGLADTQPRIAALAQLFSEMAERGEDGGDMVSRALGQAIDQLGSLNALVTGCGPWSDQLTRLGAQYAQTHDA